MYERILICTDGSKLSRKAVTSGIALAAALDADIVAYTIIPKQAHWSYENAMPMSICENLDALTHSLIPVLVLR
jgi:nucleotide-binding universal stress UspA family protein